MYIAHRGLHDNIVPENSLLAFKKAIESGYNIELDIQMTKDNVLVIFHDENTFRMTGVSKNITKSTYNEIKKLRLKDTNEKIPTLQETLNLVAGKVYLDIEIKRRKQKRKYLQLIKKTLDNYKGEYSIKSFDPTIPRWYKKHNSSIKCGVLNYSHNDYIAPKFFRIFLRNCNYLFWYKPDFIAYKLDDYTKELDEKLKKYNISIMLWTITTDEQRKKALKYTNNIIFEKIKITTKI